MIKIPKNINKVLTDLHKAGFEAYIVGGCVRDSLMGKTPMDYDITTSALPWQMKEVFEDHKRKYKNNFKIGGYKIFLDGSPQGRTAWMRTPYIDDINYYGYSTMEDNSVYEAIKMAMDDDLQILAHCNGDMAAEQYIEAIEKIGKDVKKIRPVIIHAQLIGIDQLEKVKEFGLIPSYFVAHTYYWGDIHIENFGLERARKISPAKSTLEKNILFTFHQDSPIIEPNMFETIMCAVERKTKKQSRNWWVFKRR